MKISKAKALNLINEKISTFEELLSTVNYDNIESDEYAIAYQSTRDLIAKLFSEGKATQFQADVDEWGVPGDRNIGWQLINHKKHLKHIIVRLKAFKENIENLWEEDNVTCDGKNDIQKTNRVRNKCRVFVVHGRNEKIKNSMFQFLSAIGVEPLEWLEAKKLTGKSSPYIGEILNAAFSHAQAIILLFTPDDEARLKEDFQKDKDPLYEKELTSQARPNVIFEAGMAFGYCEDRTIIVEFGELRPFSDVAGRHTIRFDGSETRRYELIEMLETAGVAVNIKGKINWLTVGDFTV